MVVFSVFFRRQSGFFFEEAAEGGLFREAQMVGNLLDVEAAAMVEQMLGLQHDVAVDPLAGADACFLFDERGKILGREVEHSGIEGHFTRLAEMLDDSRVE